ncbi:hypothetical protein NDU88_007632 [Pleurodeles waltl]|uniref:Secreted protein n=1 Tax=Pleurodeles waltl TaxID=8319 RepID=A0AAV7U0L9_PLEWA|nr:hypothetical protein NDU88_007632 [Pleurodeles waltl]
MIYFLAHYCAVPLCYCTVLTAGTNSAQNIHSPCAHWKNRTILGRGHAAQGRRALARLRAQKRGSTCLGNIWRQRKQLYYSAVGTYNYTVSATKERTNAHSSAGRREEEALAGASRLCCQAEHSPLILRLTRLLRFSPRFFGVALSAALLVGEDAGTEGT